MTRLCAAPKSFTLSAPGIEAVKNADLKVGDLIRRDMGKGKQLWKIVAIEDGKCFVEMPTIWDETFANVVGW
jgi:hypothetical protein